MKRKLTAAGAALALLSLSAALAAAKANFSGTWVLDASKSEGLPPGMTQTLKITQNEDKLDIELKLKGPDGNERTVNDSFTLDGKETPFKPVVMGGPEPRNPKRTAKWAADGNGIEMVETAEVDTPDGPDTIQMTRKWSLSADGKTLIIEQKFIGPMGSQQTKRVFAKQ